MEKKQSLPIETKANLKQPKKIFRLMSHQWCFSSIFPDVDHSTPIFHPSSLFSSASIQSNLIYLSTVELYFPCASFFHFWDDVTIWIGKLLSSCGCVRSPVLLILTKFREVLAEPWKNLDQNRMLYRFSMTSLNSFNNNHHNNSSSSIQ